MNCIRKLLLIITILSLAPAQQAHAMWQRATQALVRTGQQARNTLINSFNQAAADLAKVSPFVAKSLNITPVFTQRSLPGTAPLLTLGETSFNGSPAQPLVEVMSSTALGMPLKEIHLGKKELISPAMLNNVPAGENEAQNENLASISEPVAQVQANFSGPLVGGVPMPENSLPKQKKRPKRESPVLMIGGVPVSKKTEQTQKSRKKYYPQLIVSPPSPLNSYEPANPKADFIYYGHGKAVPVIKKPTISPPEQGPDPLLRPLRGRPRKNPVALTNSNATAQTTLSVHVSPVTTVVAQTTKKHSAPVHIQQVQRVQKIKDSFDLLNSVQSNHEKLVPCLIDAGIAKRVLDQGNFSIDPHVPLNMFANSAGKPVAIIASEQCGDFIACLLAHDFAQKLLQIQSTSGVHALAHNNGRLITHQNATSSPSNITSVTYTLPEMPTSNFNLPKKSGELIIIGNAQKPQSMKYLLNQLRLLTQQTSGQRSLVHSAEQALIRQPRNTRVPHAQATIAEHVPEAEIIREVHAEPRTPEIPRNRTHHQQTFRGSRHRPTIQTHTQTETAGAENQKQGIEFEQVTQENVEPQVEIHEPQERLEGTELEHQEGDVHEEANPSEEQTSMRPSQGGEEQEHAQSYQIPQLARLLPFALVRPGSGDDDTQEPDEEFMDQPRPDILMYPVIRGNVIHPVDIPPVDDDWHQVTYADIPKAAAPDDKNGDNTHFDSDSVPEHTPEAPSNPQPAQEKNERKQEHEAQKPVNSSPSYYPRHAAPMYAEPMYNMPADYPMYAGDMGTVHNAVPQPLERTPYQDTLVKPFKTAFNILTPSQLRKKKQERMQKMQQHFKCNVQAA